MKLENEFTVRAPLERTWNALLDVERVAECLPGARVAPSDREGIYDGQMRVKLGAMTVAYKGTLSMTKVDEASHRVVMEISAKEVKGQGGAKALMENRLIAESDGQTRVQVGTELDVSGRTAQLGRGMMETVASRLLDDFARRLEQELESPAHGNDVTPVAEPAAPPAAERAAPPAAEPTSRPASQDTPDRGAPPLDLGAVAFRGIVRQLALLAVAAAFSGLLLKRRRERGVKFVMRQRSGLRTRTFELRIGG
jgi:carbon monoxide dehydrogenase subunit G